MQKLLKNLSWVFYSQILQLASQFVSIYFLTRLLSPHDYGVFATGMILVALVNQFFVLGFSAPLIQFDNHEKYYGTGWTINLLVAVFVTISLILLMPAIVSSFLPDYLTYVGLYQLISTNVFIMASNNIGVIELYRNSRMKELFFLRGFMEFVKVVLSILFYYIWSDYRALFYSYISVNILTLIMSYLIAPIRVRIEFRGQAFRELFNFSKWIQLKNITKLVINQFDSIVIASQFSPNSLGVYNRATAISKVPERLYQSVLEVYVYPLLSRCKNDWEAVSNIYRISLVMLLIFTSNLAVYFYIFGYQTVSFILGPVWVEIVPPLSVFMLTIVIKSVLSIFFPLLRALGYPKLEFKLALVQAFVLLLISYPFTKYYGMIGAAYSTLIAALGAIPFFIAYTRRIIGMVIKDTLQLFSLFGFLSVLLIAIDIPALLSGMPALFIVFVCIVLFNALILTSLTFLFRELKIISRLSGLFRNNV